MKAQKKTWIDFINNHYSVNEELKICNIVHMYPKELTGDNGYVDARFFELHIFNTETKEKRVLQNKDSLEMMNAKILFIRIFVDKSTMVKLSGMHRIGIYQGCELNKI